MGLEGLSVAEEKDKGARDLHETLRQAADQFGELKLRVVNDMRRLFETGLGLATRWGGFFPLAGPGPGMYVFAGGHVEVDDGGHYHRVWSGLSTGGSSRAVKCRRNGARWLSLRP